MKALQVQGLVAGYGEAMVLRDVSLQVAPGEVLAVLGKNGMGKSTLLKTIMGFLPVHAGAIRLFADDALGRAPHRLASRGLAYSPQDQAIFQDLTVEENLRVGLPRGVAFAAGLERIAGFFPFLASRRRQRAGTLSGGEQKMLIIARALLVRPRLMLIDEITEGLQPSVILRLTDVLRAEKQAGGAAILLVEQNVRFALSLADRYAVLARGEIVSEGQAGAANAEAQVAEHLSV
jgi:ABC-type branched-subunit amino acid transport system ATPase component